MCWNDSDIVDGKKRLGRVAIGGAVQDNNTVVANLVSAGRCTFLIPPGPPSSRADSGACPSEPLQ